MSDINSDYPKYKTEKTVLAILKQISKECKITPYKSQNHKYTLEFFDTSSDDTLEKTLKKEFKNLKPQTVIAAKMKFKQSIFLVVLKGENGYIEIKIKCKKRGEGASRIMCELYRALYNKQKLSDEEIKEKILSKITDYEKKKQKNLIAIATENAKSSKEVQKVKDITRVNNVKESLSKFLGSAKLRDLLFDCSNANRIVYRKFVKKKTLKDINISDFAVIDSIQKKIRYFKFDFKKEVWVEQEKPTKKKKTNNTQ